MARQYEVFRLSTGTAVIVIQNDLLDEVRTRVVVPLLPEGLAGEPMQSLNPKMNVEGVKLVLMPLLTATVSTSELESPICSLVDQRDTITRAFDCLLAGV